MKFILTSLFIYMLVFDNAFAGFEFLQKSDSGKVIIFVHGLWGDPQDSFTSESGVSWPALIENDNEEMRFGPLLSTYAIGALGYPASTSDRLSIEQISTRLLTDLYDEGIFDNYNQVFFISHSLGGLVVKEMLNDLWMEDPKSSEKVMAVFLISTPSQGAPAANFMKLLPEVISGRLVADLETIDQSTYLQSLESSWQRLLRGRDSRNLPRVFCAYETQDTGPLLVVPQAYTATMCDETPRAENTDHIKIVKPEGKEDSIYRWVRGRIAALQGEVLGSGTGANNVGPTEKLPVFRAIGSSEKRDSSTAQNVLDGNLDAYAARSSWLPRPGDTIGAWVDLYLNKPCTVTGINYYIKLGGNGSQIRKAIVSFDDSPSKEILFEYKDGWQMVQISPTKTDKLRITVEDIFPMGKGNELRIIEIELYGNNCE